MSTIKCPFCYQDRMFLLHMPLTVSFEGDDCTKIFTRDGYTVNGDSQKICTQCLENEIDNLD